jgi:hypothetical protein
LKSRGEADALLRGVLAAWGLCVGIVFEAVDDSGNAVFNERNMKIDAQADTFVRETE